MSLARWELLHPRMTLVRLGFIPFWLDDEADGTAQQQLDRNYQFGGFDPFKGFTLGADNSLTYPGDPPMEPLAQAKFRDELVVFYPHSWVGIIQPDRSFVVARMD